MRRVPTRRELTLGESWAVCTAFAQKGRALPGLFIGLSLPRYTRSPDLQNPAVMFTQQRLPPGGSIHSS